jgi:hypothetical protein
MSSWIFLVVLVGALVTLFMMVVGIVAMWTRKMQFISGGRALYGPLAQLCGLWLLAALPLSAVSCGQVAYQVGAQPDPGPARAKVMEFFAVDTEAFEKGEQVKWRQEFRAAGKELALAWAFDFAAFGVALAALVWALVDLRGVRPTPRRL